MPFKSPKQQIYLKINHPKIHDRWQKNYGNAPGLSEYMKRTRKNKKKKSTKKSDVQMELLRIAQDLDIKGFSKLADKLEVIAHCGHCGQLDELGAGCKECGEPIGKPAECPSCGWRESLLCPSCTMKKRGGDNTCPDCGGDLNTSTTVEAKVLTYKEKQASPCVFPKSHPRVKDNKDHYPIPDLAHGSNALSRCQQDIGSWFDGTAEELRAAVHRAVYRKFPGLKSRKEEK